MGQSNTKILHEQELGGGLSKWWFIEMMQMMLYGTENIAGVKVSCLVKMGCKERLTEKLFE